MVYKLTWVMYTSMCSSEFVVSSYLSIVKFFQLRGRVASIILGTKGFLNYDSCLPRVLQVGEIMFEHMPRLVALGKPMAINLASLPSNGFASGCWNLCVSRR